MKKIPNWQSVKVKNMEVESIDNEKLLEAITCSNLDAAARVKQMAIQHIDSFNFCCDEGLENVLKYLNPLEIIPNNDALEPGQNKIPFAFKKYKVWFEDLKIGYPIKQGDLTATEGRIFPSECRLGMKTYAAPLYATVCRIIDNNHVEKIKLQLGELPIMVRSSRCHLAKLSSKELVEQHEDCNEFGGYFIVNGQEKLIRMLIMPKKNYPLAFLRPSVKKKSANFTGHIVQMKCMRDDLYAKSISLYNVSDGNISVGIVYRKQEFLVPVIIILKALIETSDVQIYNKLVRGNSGNSEISDRAEVLLRVSKHLSLHTKTQCLAYLGSRFRVVLGLNHSGQISDKDVGEIFLNELVCVHCKTNIDKFNSICLMIEKLYALVSEKIYPDNLDTLANQDVLLSGHLYLTFLREKLEEHLQGVRLRIIKDSSKASEATKVRDPNYLKKVFDQQTPIGQKLEYFLATGNLRSGSGLDLQQKSGYTIVAERLNNMRYFNHFHSIHRGSFFTEMKTTTVRKLLPESWGFICPVHTPDGGPCGLLNHIAVNCKMLTEPSLKSNHKKLSEICASLGMSPNNEISCIFPSNYIVVCEDGVVIGYIDPEKAEEFVKSLRYLKVSQIEGKLIPVDLEIAYIPPSPFGKSTQFPGIFLATREARFVRPVKYLASNQTDWIGPLEQLYLSIACVEEDIRNDTTHQEFDPADILSVLAQQIPFLDNNQSPRNMYQCQMAKQTMGTPYHNFPYRFDNKVYRLINPQLPLVKCKNFEDYAFGDYPSGTNAIVAVLAYTGYDMEDAMILNKSAYERGLGHACVYKTYQRELNESTGKKSRFKLMNQLKKQQKDHFMTHPAMESLDNDGLPFIGQEIKSGMPELCVYDSLKDEIKIMRSKENEVGRLDQVAVISDEKNPTDATILFKIRFPRNPIIGDKFSSRHGQKGVLSVLWPHVDMPFTETGITPDIIINPHAFPSRMTIGMLIESMAGKAGAIHAKFQETRPFETYTSDDKVRHFGEQLRDAGYNYYGNELMYSGIFGTQLKVEIYMGVVYYQRLRHMVNLIFLINLLLTFGVTGVG